MEEHNEATLALANASWFNEMIDSGVISETRMASKSDSLHYVIGKGSPFHFRFGVGFKKEQDKTLVAAIWCGENATNMGGKVQGGAISSIFDALTASVGSIKFEPMAFGTTKSIEVKFLSPTPLKTVLRFKVITSNFNENTGEGIVEAELSDGNTGEKYASCTAHMVDIKRRRNWKKNHPRERKSKL